ncbi:MAG: 1-acyl-sn-glycerol-3-phosphate acyltransferase [Muribaculaceae bacterium]|nr:1-acyl-sn-glycerol-3-phosphate acyltransferase [Muribaculaceae bacterium]
MADQPLEIDLHAILKKRLPTKVKRFVPRFVISWLAKLIRQDEMNEILRVTFPSRGSKFAAGVLQHLDISLEVVGLENIPDKRLIFASNHPLGGLDGIALIAVLGQKYGDNNIRFLVNDMLMNVEPLKDEFLPVNKFGRQGREASLKITEALASDMEILQFPAGLCSRKNKNGEIADLKWQKSFAAKAVEHQRDIVPVYFEGKNSPKFYNLARWRKKLGIKFNIEQILLPSEVCKARGKRFKIIFGNPISWETLRKSGKSYPELAEDIRSVVYSLKSKSER